MVPLIAGIAACVLALIVGGACYYFFVMRPSVDNDYDTVNYTQEEMVDDSVDEYPVEVTENSGDDKRATTTVSEEENPPMEGDYTVVVTGVNVRLRTSPEINNHNIITTSNGKNLHPNKGDRLEFRGEYGDFYKVYYQGHVAYISKQFSYLDY